MSLIIHNSVPHQFLLRQFWYKVHGILPAIVQSQTADIIVQSVTPHSGFKFLPLAEQFINENTQSLQKLFFILLSYLILFWISKMHLREWDTSSAALVLANHTHWPSFIKSVVKNKQEKICTKQLLAKKNPGHTKM